MRIDKLNRSGLPLFEDHLRQFLHKEKGKAFLQAMTASLKNHFRSKSKSSSDGRGLESELEELLYQLDIVG